MDTRYRVRAGSLFSLKDHLVWCPKYRKPVWTGAVAKKLRALRNQKAKELGATIQALEIKADPVHLFLESDPIEAPAHIAAQFKGYTSHELREEFSWLRSRLPSLWSLSYDIGSVGHLSEATVRGYIAEQKTRA